MVRSDVAQRVCDVGDPMCPCKHHMCGASYQGWVGRQSMHAWQFRILLFGVVVTLGGVASYVVSAC